MMVKIKYPNLFDLLLRNYWKVPNCPDKIYKEIFSNIIYFQVKILKMITEYKGNRLNQLVERFLPL